MAIETKSIVITILVMMVVEPGTNFALTQNKRPIISATKLGRLETCPLGFVLVNNTCVCSAELHDERLIGIPACDYGNFQALLATG